MNNLTTTLEGIVDECGINLKEIEILETGCLVDEFTRKKNKLVDDIREVKSKCRDRARLNKDENDDIIKLSIQIRRKEKSVDDQFDELKSYYQSYAFNVNENRATDENILEYRLALKSVEEEIKNMKKYTQSKEQGTELKINGLEAYLQPTLPVIDNPEVCLIHERDEEIEEKLEVIHDGVIVLKEIAGDVTEKLTRDKRLRILESKIDDECARIDQSRTKLQQLLSKAKGPDRLCFIFMLVIIILGMLSVGIMVLMNTKN
ncbi:t-SNARE coiled-coil-like proteiny domain-containing protein [Entamoeba marina]